MVEWGYSGIHNQELLGIWEDHESMKVNENSIMIILEDLYDNYTILSKP